MMPECWSHSGVRVRRIYEFPEYQFLRQLFSISSAMRGMRCSIPAISFLRCNASCGVSRSVDFASAGPNFPSSAKFFRIASQRGALSTARSAAGLGISWASRFSLSSRPAAWSTATHNSLYRAKLSRACSACFPVVPTTGPMKYASKLFFNLRHSGYSGRDL